MLSPRRVSLLALALVCLTLTARAEGPTPAPLPGSADIVTVLNVRKILDSGVFKKYGTEVVKTAMGMKEAQDVIAATGINPLKDIDSIMIAAKGELMSKMGVVIVKGKFDESKIQTFAEAESKKGTFKFKTSKVGTATVHEITPSDQPEPVFLTFADKSTIMASPDKDYLLKVAAGKTDKPNAKLGALVSKLTGKESMSIAVIATEEMKKALGAVDGMDQIAPKLESALLTVSVADGLEVKGVISATDSETVGAIKFLIGSGLTTAKTLAASNKDYVAAIGKVKVVSDKTAVTVSLVLTAADIQKLTGK